MLSQRKHESKSIRFPVLVKRKIIKIFAKEDLHELYQVKAFWNVVISPNLWRTIDLDELDNIPRTYIPLLKDVSEHTKF